MFSRIEYLCWDRLSWAFGAGTWLAQKSYYYWCLDLVYLGLPRRCERFISVLGPWVCLESHIVNFGAWTSILLGVSYRWYWCLDHESAWSLVSLIFRYARNLGDCLEYPPWVVFKLLGPWELLGIPSLLVLGPQVCLESCIVNFQVVYCRKTLGTAWSTLLVWIFYLMRLGAEEACDNNLDPLLGQSNCGD